MIAPFSKIFLWSHTAQFIVALLLGIGFGFALEKAGFGSSRKLAGVWYGYDFAVIRVMFTAIVTALIGLYGLYYLGVIDIGKVYVNPTYWWPQIIGGFIFGIGFNVGQYCPGTSAVSCATGKLDGIVFLLGFFAGVLVFTGIYPLISGFYTYSSAGSITIPEFLNVPAGIVVFVIVLIALGAFALTHYLDKKLGNTEP